MNLNAPGPGGQCGLNQHKRFFHIKASVEMTLLIQSDKFKDKFKRRWICD